MRDISRGLDYLCVLIFLLDLLNVSDNDGYCRHNRTPAIIHRDMKSSNVLITARGVAKINDFGLARVKNSTRSMVRSLVGTVHYQAPELWVPHPRYNEKVSLRNSFFYSKNQGLTFRRRQVDVYSCAMVFWEILTWHQPNKKYPFEVRSAVVWVFRSGSLMTVKCFSRE
jgi:serine/threonine protein kinase